MAIYTYSIKGKRNTQEDQHISILNLDGTYNNKMNKINLFGVFDGHGGKKISLYLKKNICLFILKKIKKKIFFNNNIFTQYINNIYNLLQSNIKMYHPRAAVYCGSTACICIQVKNKNTHILWVVNVGDSRAVLCNKQNIGIPLSIDHKPNLPSEQQRIELLGGKIVYDGIDWRIKTLSLSRAFGDLDCTPFVTHLPNIYRYNITPNDKFIILACDGLWDVLSNQNAVDFILDLQIHNFKGNYAKELTKYALNKGSYDNITVIIYFF